MRRLAFWLRAGGLAIWVMGVLAWMVGVWVTLPPDAVRPLVLTLAALCGGVLLATGAAVGRAAMREAARPEPQARVDADRL
jgi:putative copper export protein